MNVETEVKVVRIVRLDTASIEPHSYECGNVFRSRDLAALGGLLQLSHIHMNVETERKVARDALLHLKASIEPHSYECGNRRPSRFGRALLDSFN